MKRLSTSSSLPHLRTLARTRTPGVAGTQTTCRGVPSASSFSTFISAVDNSTLGFLREKLLTRSAAANPALVGRPRRRKDAGLQHVADGTAPNDAMAVSPDLHRNIFFNSNERSALRHVELTPDFIRLEFSAPNEEYRKHAGLLHATEAECRAQGVPFWLVPVGLQNNEHCGGGATILLDKRHVYDSLRSQTRRRGVARHS